MRAIIRHIVARKSFQKYHNVPYVASGMLCFPQTDFFTLAGQILTTLLGCDASRNSLLVVQI